MAVKDILEGRVVYVERLGIEGGIANSTQE
jgi:hypothetical protein